MTHLSVNVPAIPANSLHQYRHLLFEYQAYYQINPHKYQPPTTIMSDAFRKDTHTKIGEAMQPQSTKSTGTKIKESLTGTGDKVAREAQPDSSKTNTQSTMDKFGRSKDRNVHGSTGESIVDKTKDALGMGHHTHHTNTTHTHGSGL
ncbi:chaperone heat shock Hsp12 [Pyrenophora seminiperda CCB06]|uniref:Chaperone heat shock Hsp12 n=1 Tax=Pyrenophora seminiperda CCB06 TaxID=1302712 RepID=A0A3M7M6Z1_9PLEO|nr:chaperone heat shock Hsp12 [Pyrenophora seminiperda CCB06]